MAGRARSANAVQRLEALARSGAVVTGVRQRLAAAPRRRRQRAAILSNLKLRIHVRSRFDQQPYHLLTTAVATSALPVVSNLKLRIHVCSRFDQQTYYLLILPPYDAAASALT